MRARESSGDAFGQTAQQLRLTGFSRLSLTVGHLIPRVAGVSERQALSTAFEVGIHNGTLAITVALSVLDEKQLAVPAAVYSLVMVPLATIAGLILTRGNRKASPPALVEVG